MLALVTDAFGARGGIAQYNRDLLGALASMPQIGAIEVAPRLAPDPIGVLPAKLRQFPPLKSRLAYTARALWRTFANRPDIIFCGHLHMTPLAAALARWAGAKLVLQLHGIEAWRPPGQWVSKTIEVADLLLCVSRYTRARALSWANIAPEKAVVLSNTVSDDYRPGDREAARRRLGVDQQRVLLSVGRLSSRERYKGHDRIIALLPGLREQIGDVLYLVVGDGDDMPRLQALAEQMGVIGQVRFLGYASPKELPDVYRAADLFVLPSTGEGFGIVFLEAMACGTQAMGLADGGAIDALGDEELGQGVAESDFPDTLVRHLVMSRSDPESLSAAVLARFGRPVFTRQATALFTRLIEAA